MLGLLLSLFKPRSHDTRTKHERALECEHSLSELARTKFVLYQEYEKLRKQFSEDFGGTWQDELYY